MSQTQETTATPPSRSPDMAEPQWHVDCAADPADIRPVIKAIMEAQNWMLDRMPPGQKLMIQLGDRHDSQSHILVTKALLKTMTNVSRTQPNRKFAYGVEIHPDFPLKNEPLSDRLKRKIGLYTPPVDPHGRRLMDLFSAKHLISYCYDAKKSLFELCQRERISVGFNDLSYADDAYLNQKDPFTHDLIRRHKPDLLGTKIGRDPDRHEASEGVALSNIALAEQSAAHATNLNIYVQQCGEGHLKGDTNTNCLQKDSASARAEEKGFAVLCVFLDNAIGINVPDKTDTANVQSLYIRNLGLMKDKELSYAEARMRVNKHSGYKL